MGLFAIIFLALVVIIFLWAMGVYNRLIVLKNEIANAYGQIDVQLKRRYDLIPNLVETAKKYLSHERETLEAVISARAQARSASDRLSQAPASAAAISGLQNAERTLSGSLGHLFALSERYPELKADRTMHELSEELTSTENRVGFSRQAYNDSILAYNDAAKQFPALLIAKLFGFGGLPTLKVIDAEIERLAPKVIF